ncbi:MAG: hypothetical protein ACE5FO_02640 [Parvularculaceae bacterium]
MIGDSRVTTSLLKIIAVVLAIAGLSITAAWAVYRQPVELVTPEGEEIPRTSLSFSTPDDENVAIEEDEEDDDLIWLVFPGESATGGTLTVELDDGPVEISIPAAAVGEKIVVDVAAGVAVTAPFEPGIGEDVIESDAVETSAFDLSEYLLPIEIGPRAEVGTESVGQKALKGAAGAALKGLLGGGSRRSSSRSSGPRTKRDPTRKADPVSVVDPASEAGIGVRTKWTKEGLLVSTNIDESDDRGTFHYVYLVDETGRQLAPKQIEVYKIWRKHTLTVSWTRSEYVDGALVSQTSGGWTESWTEDLGIFTRNRDGEAAQAPGIWQMVGYDRAHAGLRRIGTVFDLSPEQLAELGKVYLIVHITRPSLDPVITAPFAVSLTQNVDGGVALTPYSP